MKKRLEAELISIAHRILKLKNKSEVDQLYKETQKLYDTLAVLKFYQDNFESVKSDVSEEVLEEKLEQANAVEATPEPKAEVKQGTSDSEQAKQVVEPIAEIEPEPEVQEEAEEEPVVSEEPEQIFEEEESSESEQPEPDQEEVVAEEPEEVKEEPSFKPIFELEVEHEEEVDSKETKSEEATEEKLEDHIGKYADPIFEKINDVTLFPSDSSESEQAKQTPAETREDIRLATPTEEPKAASGLNDSMSKSIAIGLNDRIGFVQHLFNDSNEDFNRVISQLNTFDTFEEAKNFINEMVIPDYNYWIGEEDYIERFMTIVEKRFS